MKHVVGITIQTWGMYNFPASVPMIFTMSSLLRLGHTRPLVNLSAQLIKLRSNVYITLLTTHNLYQRARCELARCFDAGEEGLATRVRYEFARPQTVHVY